MRSFQFVFWITFLFIYILISLSSYRATLNLIGKKNLKGIFFSWSALILFFMVALYIWPGNIRNTENYALYFIFNGILFIDLCFKLLLSFSYLGGLFLQKRKEIFSWFGMIISAGMVILLLQGIFVGKNNSEVKSIDIKFNELPERFDNYKILHISDVHLGSFIFSKKILQDLKKQITAIAPDLVLMTGDLVNNFFYELDGYEEIFSEIAQSAVSFSILGNHDYGNYSNWDSDVDKKNNFDSLILAQERFGFNVLRNENCVVKEGNDSIYVIGVENWGHPPFPQYADMEKALEGVPENAFKVLLSHDPAHWDSEVKGKKNIELTLSGHTHGLQWGIKPAGIPFSFSYLVRKNWGGLYKWNGNSYLYVNSGLGTVGAPWRIDMPAEITVITLKRIKVDRE